MSEPRSRRLWVLVHRWAGLYMALFLAVAGLTGSIIAFQGPLREWLNPSPPTSALARTGTPLDPVELLERARAQAPATVVFWESLQLGAQPGDPVGFIVEPATNPATGQPYTDVPREFVLDAYTGKVVHIRYSNPPLWPITRANVIDVIYRLHYSLALPGQVGTWLFGIAAIVWTLDCFIGAYLTFPPRLRRRVLPARAAPATDTQRKTWWQRWQPAWRVRWRGGGTKLNFDLHRAGGLWTWLILLVLAWSSVGLNLRAEVYDPVMGALFDMRPADAQRPPLPAPLARPRIDWRDALARARALAAEEGKRQGFRVLAERELSIDRDHGQYVYLFQSDRDIGEGGGASLLFDANTGALHAVRLQDRQRIGPWLSDWLFALHFGAVWGLPMKFFICFMGLVVTALSVTGVIVWWRKRKARRHARHRLAVTRA